MTVMPSVLPCLIDPASLREDPLAFLARARNRFGDAIIIGNGPLFSPAADCPGVVALFGSHHHRQVLADFRSFVSPESSARALGLPESIVNLNRSLHSMHGRQHETHKAVLAKAMTPTLLVKHQASIVAAVDSFADAWRQAGSIPIFAGMRSLVAEVAVILLFGEAHPSRGKLQAVLNQYFDVRRLLSPTQQNIAVAEVGNSLDAALSAAIDAADGKDGLPARLAAELGNAAARAHINVLFMSMAEPVTVAATWLLLILSQQPALRRYLRAAYLGKTANAILPVMIEHAILESLRLLSPSAVMVRVTSREVACADAVLPRGCEIILVPFLAHRDPAVFPRPTLFQPERWARKAPSVFEYLPFGAGMHACIGSRLAISMIGTIVGEMLVRADPVLTYEQAVDWRIDITFRPRFDIEMSAADILCSPTRPVVQWHGPVAQLIEF